MAEDKNDIVLDSMPGADVKTEEETKPFEVDLNFEDSVKSFEEGVGLVKECQKLLSAAELKVKKLLDNGDTVDLDN